MLPSFRQLAKRKTQLSCRVQEDREGGRSGRERGFVIIWITLLMVSLLGFTGLAVDLGNWYLHIQRAQRAADAAALGGDPLMPGNFNSGPISATSQARLVLKNNGIVAGPKFSFAISRTPMPSQLQVSVKTTVSNVFLPLIGFNKNTTFQRTAIADHQSGLHLASGRNLLGGFEPLIASNPNDEPWANAPIDDGGYFLSIAGGGDWKVDGDRFSPHQCIRPFQVFPNGSDNCSGGLPGTNDEATNGNPATQYNYHIHIAKDPAGGGPVNLAISSYDAGFASNGGNDCPSSLPGGTDPKFCANDQASIPPGAANPMKTTYKLLDKPNGRSLSTCKTYDGTTNSVSAFANGSDSAWNWIHNWETICNSIRIDTSKENDVVVNVTSDNGFGRNQFLLRAGLFTTPVGRSANGRPTGFLQAKSRQLITIEADINQGVMIQKPASGGIASFPLTQVPGSYAGQTVRFQFFDIGDAGVIASASGSLQLVDQDGRAMRNCRYSPPPGSAMVALSNCKMNFTGDDWQAQLINFEWNVPSSWAASCHEVTRLRGSGCWLVAKINFESVAVDNSVWTLNSPSKPLRLIK